MPFPTSLPNLPTNRTDGVDAGDDTPGSTNVGTHAADHNNVNTEVNAIGAELGTEPSGASATVKARLDAVDTAVSARQLASEKGQANGYASLDSGGKVPSGQLPSSAMEYQGTWNASTNSPTLADGTGSAGDVYRVSTAGTRDLGSGAIEFAVGDLVIYSGSVWQKSDTTDAVASVAGKTGVVTLVKADVGLANVDNTSDASKPISAATQTALDAKQDAATAATDAELTAHTGRTDNPHSVTKTQVGLGNVDNTSDANKPISTATQTALDAKAPLASPVFTGNPTAPTPAGGDNDTSIATTAFVQSELSAKAPLASPAFTGNPTAPTATAGDNDTTIATTAFVQNAIAGVGGVGKFATTITGDGAATQFTVTHNRASTDVVISVYDVTADLEVIVTKKRPTSNTARIDFDVAPANGKQYRVVVVG